jgi:beta-galactosidase
MTVGRDDLARIARWDASDSFKLRESTGPVAGTHDRFWELAAGGDGPSWLQLSWDAPVVVEEIVVRQKTPSLLAFVISVTDAGTRERVTVGSFEGKGNPVPATVVCAMPRRAIQGVRLETMKGPGFVRGIEVFADTLPPATVLAGDANGNIIGMVCDGHGFAPIPRAMVKISGSGSAGRWQASALSDEAGLFTVRMPLGLRGTLRITTEAGGRAHQTAWKAEGLPYGLTPLSVHGRKAAVLDDGWKFACNPPKGFHAPGFDDGDWSPIKVPAHFIMEGFHSPDGIGGYRKRFTLAAGEGRLKLRFDGVHSGAEVWVNGSRLAYHEGGALPFEVDITDAARPGENLLAVRVTEHTVTGDRLDHMSFYAGFPLAGIMRKVTLARVPACHIGVLAFETVFDRRYENAVISGTVAVANESADLVPATLSFSLCDPRGRAVSIDVDPIRVTANPWERVERRIEIPVTKPMQWDAEHPNLYTLTLVLKRGSRPIQRLDQRIGFRQTEIRGTRILINGVPVKIRGTCHHDVHPLMGRAITIEHERRDLCMIKDANLNSLRTSHYPPLPELLDIADEIGLYIEDEGSFCWADGTDDLRLTPRIMQMNAELIARDRNHPSVFMWSVCNESSFGYGFRCSHRWVRAADPRRPTSAATGADLEIATLHNPISVARIREREATTAPLLFDEAWCIYQGIFGDVGELWVDPGIRDYYAEPLSAIYEAMMKSRVTQGSQIWCWADDIFCVPGRGLEYGRGTAKSHFIENAYHVPDRGLCGDAPWGVVDGWQRPKPEYWIVRKLFCPVRIRESVLTPLRDGALRLRVRNDFDHTDLSELVFRWALASERGTARISVKPHATGTLIIRPKNKPRPQSELAITAGDRFGRTVGEFLLPVGAEPDQLPVAAVASSPIRIREESSLATRAVRVDNAIFDLAFAIQDQSYYDHGGGHLRRCVGFGRSLLLEAPQVHVLPTGTPTAPQPDRSSWQVKEMQSTFRGRSALVRIAGTYNLFDAEYEWTITPSGEIVVASRATWNGDDLAAREIGMRFAVPLPCDVLRWSRKAEWRVYPADHIGRPRGCAQAVLRHQGTLPPRWPWSEDATSMGSNDFRSTKRRIRWASIGYGDGPGVLIRSDGTQHVRAMVESDRIAVHVLDWYGGTNARLPEWYLNYGEGQVLRRGQVLESTLRLQLLPNTGSRAGAVS